MAVQESVETTDFLMMLFKEAYELIDTLDYGCLFFYNGSQSPYVSDFEGLTKEPLNGIQLKDLFKNKVQVKTRKKLQLSIDKNIGSKETQVLKGLNERIKGNPYSALISIRYEGELLAVMLLSRKSEQAFTPGEERIILALGNIGASYYLNEDFRGRALKFQREIVYSLVEMLEIHDEYTKGHSEVVANLSRRFAEYLGLSEDVVEDIYWAGLLHDIGKILVDQSVLQKKGKLTLAEEETIKKHSIYGYQALNQSKLTMRIAEYVLYHHERYDGEGYPHGLKGEEIPLGSKIIALADSYEAIGSSRSYKKGLTKEKVIKEIKDNLGRRYDPIIGEVFIEMIQG
jgi:putative nucleotidyltransferase with HDIG domain